MPRPTERSFRVIYPPVGKQPPRFQFPVLPDRFHTPYPASAPVYLRQTVVRHDADNLFSPPSPEDRITQLPAEIFAMIFSALSVADLDASRYVCHRWWDRIMGSNEVLFNVLHNKSASSARSRSHGSSDSYIGKRDDLRQLARGLDRESSALSTLWLEDSWRSRYRRCGVEFSFFNYFEVEEMACPPDYLKHTFSSARFSSTGNFGLFVVRDAIDLAEAGSQANAVLFYHISWSGRPVYIGSIPGPRDDTVINAVHLSEIEQGRSWMGMVQIGESSLPFSIKLRQGWLNTCSPYILTPLDAADGKKNPMSLLEDEKRSQTGIEEAPSNTKKPWRLLEHISTLRSGHDDHGRPQRSYYIATRSDTDKLWIIGFELSQSSSDFVKRLETDFNVYDGTQLVSFSAILSPPHRGSLYRNVVVAPFLLHGSLLRVAVVWQLWAERINNSKPELYYYDLYKTSDGISSPHLRPGFIQGKRISSLGWRIGGLCASSPVRKMGCGTPSSYYRKDQTALGGMELVQYPGEFGTCDEQKLIVWGPSKRAFTTRITLITFYLRFADPKRMEYLRSRCRRFAPNGRLNGVQDSINEVCACSLHDQGYRVVLPYIWRRRALQENGLPTLMQWLQRGAGSSPPDISAGLVTRYDPPRRVAALERNEEVLRERIREMKRTPMTDEEIAQEWQGCWWTHWNAVAKPDGWKML